MPPLSQSFRFTLSMGRFNMTLHGPLKPPSTNPEVVSCNRTYHISYISRRRVRRAMEHRTLRPPTWSWVMSNDSEIPVECFEGKLLEVKQPHRQGRWRFHGHYDRD